MDDRDPEVPRLGGGIEGDPTAIELDGPRRRRDHTRQNLHQRGLAGAILSEQGRDLAAADVEVHAFEGMRAAVNLRDVARREHDIGGRRLDLRRSRHFTSSLTGVMSQLSAVSNLKAPMTETVFPVSLAVSTFDRTRFFVSLFRADPAFW